MEKLNIRSLCVSAALLSLSVCYLAEGTSRRVCVIGAGIAGLTSAKYLKEEGLNFTVYEATNYVGGTWRYDPRVGPDENGLPLHTSMYLHLRTNHPKSIMELRGFPVSNEMRSYPRWEDYYDYIKAYSKHFALEEHIKFLHNVISISREDDTWKVKHVHLPTGEEFVDTYDFIIVGTGHHSKPNYPDISGEKMFKGTIIHSHDFRTTYPFRDQRVLIVGAGPSAMDISLDVAPVSKTLIHSHHLKVPFGTKFPSNYIKKPDVKKFNESGAIFEDNTYEDIDAVIYCTGYEYYYPFLDKSSGLTIAPHGVIPLYQYMVNIHQPTMVMMGLVVRACLVVAIDAQARYATALAKGNFTLPSEEVMMEDWQKRYDAIRSRGRPISDLHLLARNEDQYYANLTADSGIDRVPPVMYKIRKLDMEAKMKDLYTYRNYLYEVIDDETFTRRLEEPTASETSSV